MKKFLLILVFLILCPNSFADVIKLKSGKTVEGTITEQTNEYIKIDSDSGMEVTYYLDEIQTISFKSDSSYSLNVNQPEIHIHNPGAMAEYNKKALALNQLTIQEKKKDGGTTEYCEGGYLKYGGSEVIVRDIGIYQPSGCLDMERILNGTYGEYLETFKTNNSGILDGPYKMRVEGQILEEGNFKNGKLDGVVKSYDQNGQIHLEISFKNGNLDGKAKQYWPTSGQLMWEHMFKDGVRQGSVNLYHENGQISVEKVVSTKDGKREGIIKTYYENGQLESEAILEDDNLIEEKEYDEEGNLVFEYKEGVPPAPGFSGVHKEYYKNDQLKREMNFEDGKLEGIFKEYNESGWLESEKNYKKSKLDGLIKKYYFNGQVGFEQIFKDGNLIEQKEYSFEGNLISNENKKYERLSK